MSKRMRILAVIVCLVEYVHAQTLPAFKPMRYDERYGFLKNDTARNTYERIKYSPLSANGNTYLSFGGEVRYQYFGIRHEDWGESPDAQDGYILSRFLAHADFHAGKHFRTFIQLQGSMAGSKASASVVEENPLDLHQAFFDVTTGETAAGQITLRAGRQEFSYGSQRLIGVRELPNNRQAFDAARVILQQKALRADAFYSHAIDARKDIFDDGLSDKVKLWGLYLVHNNVPGIRNIDLYYLGLYKRQTTFDDGTGREQRHSLGTRLWAQRGDWRYDVEGVYQFGSLGSKNISAWTLSCNTGYQFSNIRYQPELGLKTEVISGDRKYNDGTLGTFNPLFPRGAYFGLAALIGPANLVDVHPSLSFDLSSRIIWNIDYDVFWRYNSNDGIYAPNVSQIYSGRNTNDTFIGNQLATDIQYTPDPYLTLKAELTWFEAGSYLKEAGPGKNMLFGGFTATVKF
jgi:hypothetical protein